MKRATMQYNAPPNKRKVKRMQWTKEVSMYRKFVHQRVTERKIERPWNPIKRHYNKRAADVDSRPRSMRTPYNLRATTRNPD